MSSPGPAKVKPNRPHLRGLYAALNRNDMPIDDLAKRLGLATMTVYSFASQRLPKPETIRKIANILHISLQRLVEGK